MAVTVTCIARATSPKTAKVNTNVALSGTHEYTIVNPDNKKLTITVEVIIPFQIKNIVFFYAGNVAAM